MHSSNIDQMNYEKLTFDLTYSTVYKVQRHTSAVNNLTISFLFFVVK